MQGYDPRLEEKMVPKFDDKVIRDFVRKKREEKNNFSCVYNTICRTMGSIIIF